MNTQMDRYRATRDFGMAGLSIQRGTMIEFDGYNIAVEGRPAQPLPTFKGAIKTGWAVLEAAYDASAPLVRPTSANIRVHPADSGNPNNRAAAAMIATAQSEEQIVGDVADHAATVRKGNQRRQVVGVQVESQDGIPVRELKTLANSRGGVRTELTGSNTHQLIEEANRVQIDAGKGITRDEVMERLAPEQRKAYQAEIQARKAMHVVLDEQVAVAGPETQGRVVGRVAAPKEVESLGVKLTTTVGGGTDTVDLSGYDSDAPAEIQVVEAEGMRFTTTNGPRKKGQPLEAPRVPESLDGADPRRVIARSICRDFPEVYDFDLPLRKKVARLRADFEERPDVIRAVAAAETDSEMRLLLVDEFPEAFQI